MPLTIITDGFTGEFLVTGGYGLLFIPPVYTDPQAGYLLSTDTDPIFDIDPQAGTVITTDLDSLNIDPRAGTLLSADTDPVDTDPQSGTLLN